MGLPFAYARVHAGFGAIGTSRVLNRKKIDMRQQYASCIVFLVQSGNLQMKHKLSQVPTAAVVSGIGGACANAHRVTTSEGSI